MIEAAKTVYQFYSRDQTRSASPVESRDYRTKFINSESPIVIDNGSYQFRAGWAFEEDPRLNIRALVARSRNRKENDGGVIVGADLRDDEVSRMATRSAFDRNVLSHLETQECIFDYCFDSLGIDTDRVNHPVLVTETVCNPNYSRALMSELLFECYGVPAVCYGIDGVFSLYHNMLTQQHALASPDALVVSLGHTAAHILPVVRSAFAPHSARRVSVGGLQLTDLMLRLLNLKYPQHRSQLHWGRAQQVVEEHAYVATDFAAEAHEFQTDAAFARDHTRTFQLPYVPIPEAPQPSEEEINRRQQWRKEQGNRLRDAAQRRKKDKLRAQEEDLAEYERVLSLKQISRAAFQEELEAHEMGSEQALVSAIKQLRAAIAKSTGDTTKPTLEQQQAAAAAKASDEEKLYALVDIPDDQLTPEQIKDKRRQRMLKNASQGRARAKLKRDEEKALQDKLRQEDEERRNANPQEWLQHMTTKLQGLVERREHVRERHKTSRADRKASLQQRMKLVADAGLAADVGVEDDFGANDDDWLVYRAIANDLEDEEHDLDAQIQQIEEQLATFGPRIASQNPGDRNAPILVTGSEARKAPSIESFQINVAVERCRVPEVLFAPCIIGLHSAGLMETIATVLASFDPKLQTSLAAHVFVTGGLARLPGMHERIAADLQSIRPHDSRPPPSVVVALDPSLDAWRGAARWARHPSFGSSSITRQMYDEQGPDYLKEHRWSNTYVKTMAPPPEAAAAPGNKPGRKRKDTSWV